MTSDFKPAELDIEIVKGDYWVESFALTLDNNPIDLSTATINISVTQGCSNTLIWEAESGDGISVSGADDNQINVSKLVDIDSGDYEWALKVTYQTGVVKTYLWGQFKVYLNIP